MTERELRTARVVSVVAATAISLACGTNVRFYDAIQRLYLLIRCSVCLLCLGSSLRRQVEALLDPEQSDSTLLQTRLEIRHLNGDRAHLVIWECTLLGYLSVSWWTTEGPGQALFWGL